MDALNFKRIVVPVSIIAKLWTGTARTMYNWSLLSSFEVHISVITSKGFESGGGIVCALLISEVRQSRSSDPKMDPKMELAHACRSLAEAAAQRKLTAEAFLNCMLLLVHPVSFS